MSDLEGDYFQKPWYQQIALALLVVVGMGPKSDDKPKNDPPRPMRVLVLGLGRCGTTCQTFLVFPSPAWAFFFAVFPSPNESELTGSDWKALREALKILGYQPYDSADRFVAGHDPLWAHALRAKFYAHGRKWDRADFDQVTAGYDVSPPPVFGIVPWLLFLAILIPSIVHLVDNTTRQSLTPPAHSSSKTSSPPIRMRSSSSILVPWTLGSAPCAPLSSLFTCGRPGDFSSIPTPSVRDPGTRAAVLSGRSSAIMTMGSPVARRFSSIMIM